MSEKSKVNLIRFILIFFKLYKVDFYSDYLSNALLRKFNFDKEYSALEEASKSGMDQEEDGFGGGESYAQKMLKSIRGSDNNKNLEPWNTMQVAIAYHSKDQDVIFNQINTNVIDWELFQKLSIPIWLKDVEKLKQLIEGVAKTEYKNASDDITISNKAERTAMWYILINKKSMLCNLYKTEPENKKVYDLLCKDFTDPKNQKTADKNAMALYARKKYDMVIAFFLLANKVGDAINAALTKLNDLNLAILIGRLALGNTADKTIELINKYFIEDGKTLEDPWLVSIGYWWKSEHFEAINTISSMISEKKTKLSQQVFDQQEFFNLYRENVVFKVNHENPTPAR